MNTTTTRETRSALFASTLPYYDDDMFLSRKADNGLNEYSFESIHTRHCGVTTKCFFIIEPIKIHGSNYGGQITTTLDRISPSNFFPSPLKTTGLLIPWRNLALVVISPGTQQWACVSKNRPAPFLDDYGC